LNCINITSKCHQISSLPLHLQSQHIDTLSKQIFIFSFSRQPATITRNVKLAFHFTQDLGRHYLLSGLSVSAHVSDVISSSAVCYTQQVPASISPQKQTTNDFHKQQWGFCLQSPESCEEMCKTQDKIILATHCHLCFCFSKLLVFYCFCI